MNSTIKFEDDNNFTFVQIDGSSAGTYDRKARAHIAHQRRRKPKTKAAIAPVLNDRSPKRAPVTQGLPNPLNRLSTFARDPFTLDVLQPRAAESKFRELFSSYFYLPRPGLPALNVAGPEDSFLKAARRSRFAYHNLIILTVVFAEAPSSATATQAVLRNQARVMEEYRQLIRYYFDFETRLSPAEFQDLFTGAFSFYGRNRDRQIAYDAVVSANAAVLLAPQNISVRHLVTVEWLRMLMPRPGPIINMSTRYGKVYRKAMLDKIEWLLDFLDEVQTKALAGRFCEAGRHFRPGTAIWRLVNLNPASKELSEPCEGFYPACRHRILFLLHLHLIQHFKESGATQSELLLSLQTLAEHCLSYEGHDAIAYFLWGFLCLIAAKGICWNTLEPFYTWAIKEMGVLHELGFVEEMISWLPQERSIHQQSRLQFTDLDSIRESMRRYYSPTEELHTYAEDTVTLSPT